jgi:hypothetical protein
MDDASDGSPGTDLVPLHAARSFPREFVTAADLVLGAGARAGRLALGAGAVGRDVTRVGVRVVAALPGARLAARLLVGAARPLADEGAGARQRAVEQAQRALEALVPAIVELIDVDAVVRRIDADAVVAAVDVDALLARTDVNALLRRADVNALLERVDVDAFVAGVDLDALIARVDVDAIAARIDVNTILQRVDVDAVVEQTELGTIVARSTSGFASEALDAARAQTVGADTLVTRIVDRLLRRRGEAPLGPPLLVHEEAPPPSAGPEDPTS